MEEENDYLVNKKLNIKQTLIANIFYLVFLILPVTFYTMGVEGAKTIEEPYAQAMVIIFSMYFVLRMLLTIGQPQFVYDEILENKKRTK